MCKAFSCLFLIDKSVIWKFGVDSHSTLQESAKLTDQTADPAKMQFARVEITPDNGNYLEPDHWTMKVDESIRPAWFSLKHKDAGFAAHEKWLVKLNKVVVHGPLVHPFHITPPAKITAKHITLLRQSAWVRDSVRDSVWVSVRDSVRASVGDSVWDSVRNSVWASVGDSVWDSVVAYAGSRFRLQRKAWKYAERIKTKGYPFQPCVDLWMQGLVPSFDGKTWRLHGGPKAKVLFEISAKELRKR